jgi:lysophospholipase L1-like esterase
MDSPVKPTRALLFICSVSLAMGLLMVLFPNGKIPFLGLKIPQWQTLFAASRGIASDDLPEVMADMPLDLKEVTGNVETLESLEPNARLLYSPKDSSGLSLFIQALEKMAQNGSSLRVLHYGDSQIEGDRMTSLLREYFQMRFGGEGPSLQPVFPFVPSFSIQHTASSNWQRYTHFGPPRSRVKSKQYGIQGLMARFVPADQPVSSDTVSAWLEFKPSYVAYNKARTFRRITFTYGNLRAPLSVRLYLNDTLHSVRTWMPVDRIASDDWKLTATPRKIRIEMEGTDSPDAYGIAFDGNRGISVDNIAMRGAAGVTFTGMDRTHFGEALGRENVGLVLLQFGGNAVPHVHDQAAIDRYGRSIALQIRNFKKWCPDASIVLIGPSDMCQKVDLDYITFPNLEKVRDALKQAAFDEKIAYFDTYAFMGGAGSMRKWVEEMQPPLAGPDYIHFTPKGSRKAGEGIVRAIEAQLQNDGLHVD